MKKIYVDGSEVTEEKNGCNVHGFLVSEPKVHKISEYGGKGSKCVVIPAEVIPKLTCDSLKIHILEQFGENPIIVLTHPDKVLKVGTEKP